MNHLFVLLILSLLALWIDLAAVAVIFYLAVLILTKGES